MAPRGDCPRWSKYIREVSGGDGKLAAFLQRLAGYAATGSTREHALAFLWGTGANGKSVFLSTVAGVLGDYAAIAPLGTFLDTRGERHPTELAGLRGARLVTATETERGQRWAEAKVKALTGSDRISARFMRQDFFEFVPTFKLVVAGNHRPALRGVYEALRRRLHLVPFTITIPPEQRDPVLTERLRQEWPGILAWIVEGVLEWQRLGLAPPAAVTDATADYLAAEDALGRWSEECRIESERAQSLVGELFASWSTWAEEAREFVGSKKGFFQALQDRGFRLGRGGKGRRQVVGLMLRASLEDVEVADGDTSYCYPRHARTRANADMGATRHHPPPEPFDLAAGGEWEGEA